MKTICKILLLLFCAYSCQLKKDDPVTRIKDEKIEIEKIIRNSIEWAQKRDTALLYSIIANDTDYLEVDPDDRVVKGITNFRKAEKFWLDPRFKAVRCEIWELKISLSQDGTVAWFYCMLNDMNEWDVQPANWENTRWTGVLEKREGQWRTVQQHFSFAQE
jgi:ketosteroid isomerase-like protein